MHRIHLDLGDSNCAKMLSACQFSLCTKQAVGGNAPSKSSKDASNAVSEISVEVLGIQCTSVGCCLQKGRRYGR